MSGSQTPSLISSPSPPPTWPVSILHPSLSRSRALSAISHARASWRVLCTRTSLPWLRKLLTSRTGVGCGRRGRIPQVRRCARDWGAGTGGGGRARVQHHRGPRQPVGDSSKVDRTGQVCHRHAGRVRSQLNPKPFTLNPLSWPGKLLADQSLNGRRPCCAGFADLCLSCALACVLLVCPRGVGRLCCGLEGHVSCVCVCARARARVYARVCACARTRVRACVT